MLVYRWRALQARVFLVHIEFGAGRWASLSSSDVKESGEVSYY